MRYSIDVFPLDDDRGAGLPAWRWMATVEAEGVFQCRRGMSPLRMYQWAYALLASYSKDRT